MQFIASLTHLPITRRVPRAINSFLMRFLLGLGRDDKILLSPRVDKEGMLDLLRRAFG